MDKATREAEESRRQLDHIVELWPRLNSWQQWTLYLWIRAKVWQFTLNRLYDTPKGKALTAGMLAMLAGLVWWAL